MPLASFTLAAKLACNVRDGRVLPLDRLRGTAVHAVAGIGHPERFFRLLQSHGIEVIPHAHADHAALSEQDLCFDDGRPVLVTEKDAMRCRGIAPDNCWYVPVDMAFEEDGAAEWVDRMARDIDHREMKAVP